MFSDLLTIIELLKGAVARLCRLSINLERKAASLEMLKTYFLILDAHDDGQKLLESVTADPVTYVKVLSGSELQARLDIWDAILRRQSRRLYEVQGYIASQSYLSVVDPDAQKSIERVIGYKMDRVVTLHRLGAGLFFRTIFPINESPEDIAALVVQVFTKQESGAIDLNAIRIELGELKEGLNQFRSVIMEFIDKEGLLTLSNEARRETLFGGAGK